VSTVPARHRERYYGSTRKLSTITPEFCPRCTGINVHVHLEILSIMSRNTHTHDGPAYQAALLALAGGAIRDMRIVEGV
jgi:hypothetical protein